MGILIRGSINADEVFTVEQIVSPGQTIASTGYTRSRGGKGANVALAAANAGGEVSLRAHVGTDGLWLKDLIRQSGVNVDQVLVDNSLPQGRAIIQVEQESGENSIILFNGSNWSTLPLPPLNYQLFSHLVVQNEIRLTDTIDALRQARQAGLVTIFNPSPMLSPTEMQEFPFELVHYLIVNQGEAALLGGSVKKLPKDGLLIVTKGAESISCFGSDGRSIECGIEKVKVLDSTGAGDTFLGYFVAGLAGLKTLTLDHAQLLHLIKFASTAASMACEVAGANPPKLLEVQRRLSRSTKSSVP